MSAGQDPWTTAYECAVHGSFMTIPGEWDRAATESARRYGVVDLRTANPTIEHLGDTPDVYWVFGAADYWGWIDVGGVHISSGSVDDAQVALRTYADIVGVLAASDGVYVRHQLGDDASVSFIPAEPS